MLSNQARSFYEEYRHRHRDMEAAAQLASRVVHDSLRSSAFDIHLVAGRAKDPASLLRKMRSKNYGNPAFEVTDQVGVRVITYFPDQVDPIVSRLRETFEVDEGRSVDKREALTVREFGYRSVHLIVRARLTGVEGAAAQALRDLWFEIQVRSLLEHAWAEIEHELVYKSGTVFPEETLRAFAGLAAQLEDLDQRFLSLRSEHAQLVDGYVERYQRGEDAAEQLDAARLCALLEVLRPEGYSFRAAAAGGSAHARNVSAACVEALQAVGVSSAAELRQLLESDDAAELVGGYASLEQITPAEVSHLAVCVLLAGAREKTTIFNDFPDLVDDSRLREALAPDDEVEGDGGAPEAT